MGTVTGSESGWLFAPFSGTRVLDNGALGLVIPFAPSNPTQPGRIELWGPVTANLGCEIDNLKAYLMHSITCGHFRHRCATGCAVVST